MAIEAARALQAYAQAQIQAKDITGAPGGKEVSATAAPSDFGALVQDAVKSAVDTTRQGEAMAAAGVNGEAAIVDVVTAVSAAEVTVQSVVAVRDRVISAYQEIMRMPI